MRVAAIDIGTNTILMLVADVAPDGTLSVVRDDHAIARLGEGVDQSRRILGTARQRADEVLRAHVGQARSLGADRIVAVGTSALRDAANREELISHWKQHVGIEVSVLPSGDEARLTYLGCLSGEKTSDDMRAVIDIGGGSTEITVGRGPGIVDRFSVDLGAVRLTERYWKTYPPSSQHVEEARSLIGQTLRAARSGLPNAQWHAVAGTPTTLATMALRLQAFDPVAIDGYQLVRSFVASAAREIMDMPLDALRRHPQIHPQRADIMGAGALILSEVMETYGVNDVTVSVRGLRYGVALASA